MLSVQEDRQDCCVSEGQCGEDPERLQILTKFSPQIEARARVRAIAAKNLWSRASRMVAAEDPRCHRPHGEQRVWNSYLDCRLKRQMHSCYCTEAQVTGYCGTCAGKAWRLDSSGVAEDGQSRRRASLVSMRISRSLARRQSLTTIPRFRSRGPVPETGDGPFLSKGHSLLALCYYRLHRHHHRSKRCVPANPEATVHAQTKRCS